MTPANIILLAPNRTVTLLNACREASETAGHAVILRRTKHPSTMRVDLRKGRTDQVVNRRPIWVGFEPGGELFLELFAQVFDEILRQIR